jgi:hypothetical protein
MSRWTPLTHIPSSAINIRRAAMIVAIRAIRSPSPEKLLDTTSYVEQAAVWKSDVLASLPADDFGEDVCPAD